MAREFKTVGEAVEYCRRFGLKKSPVSEDLFVTASALHTAMDLGFKIASSVSPPIFVDAHADNNDLTEKMVEKAKELGKEMPFIVIDYLDGEIESNTISPE